MKALSSRLVLVVALCFGFASQTAAADEPKAEPGFSLLFDGKDFSGWKTKQGESLDKKTEAFGGRFKAHEGKLVIDDKVKGDVVIETAKEIAGDVQIKFEFLPGAGCNNDLFLHGLKFDIKPGDVKNLKEGQWHSFEIIAQGDKVEFKCNGESQRSADRKVKSSPFGLRAEFGSIEYRNVQVKQLDK